ncbi:MAG: Na/Pi cotransporter family protein, partial [Oscillospiraceae bacterium]|nr:Na/Pi cotransporter family protein [Oscillospiraceae bacterium]
TFDLVYPIIMGINLGTCVTTAMVCAIGSSKDAKRAGVVHIVFNTIGTILFMIAMTILRSAGAFAGLWESIVDSGVIANFQTIFNLITAVALLPFTGLLVKISCVLVKDDPVKEDKYPELAALDRKLMISPAVALGEVKKSMIVMAKAAKDNVALSLEQLKQYSAERTEEINACEERIDRFADTADNYLIELSKGIDMDRDSNELNLLMQCIPNIERIGDYATNFDEMALEMHSKELDFSDGAKQEIDILGAAVAEIIDLTVAAIERDDEASARCIEPLEEVIDDMILMLKDRHTTRLRQGVCSVYAGLTFMDLLTHLERAADQCSSIAMLLLGKFNESIRTNHHHYLQELHASGDASYLEEQERRREQFLEPLKQIKF